MENSNGNSACAEVSSDVLSRLEISIANSEEYWFDWKLCSVLQNSKKSKGAYFSTKGVFLQKGRTSNQNTGRTHLGRTSETQDDNRRRGYIVK